jgi:hypothetical protein
MSGFDDRLKGFEAKFTHDQEIRFRVMATRNRLLGRWAAERLGVPQGEMDAYVLAVVKSDFDESGDEDIIRKVLADFEERGVALERGDLLHQLDQCLAEAKRQVARETEA